VTPRSATRALDRPAVRYAAGVLVLAATYYGAAKVGQTLRYTASVSAIWPPAGLGIAALYLWGLRWWPGIFLAELVINAELLGHSSNIPLGSIVGQYCGNMAEVVVGAILLRRIVGPRMTLGNVEEVGGMLLALGTATAISATVGTISMVLGDVVDLSGALSFWRTWWLGDTSGGLVVLPLVIAWARDPLAAWRRLRTWEGALLIVAVVTLTTVAVASSQPLLYMIFPALVWAAIRFGPSGATLSVAIVAGLTIGITAHQTGPFSSQPIDERTLSTQLYIFVAALTTLFLSAIVSERERSARALAAARLREDERTQAERHRIARDLHDSVSQSLFSTVLHTRTAQKALRQNGDESSGQVAQELQAIGDLTRGAQTEMRSLIFELGHDQIEAGLVAALEKHAARIGNGYGPAVTVDGPGEALAVSPRVELQLFNIGREALANVAKHAHATAATVTVETTRESLVVEVRDDGLGFDPTRVGSGHFGLESMRGRASEIGAELTIASSAGRGTVVRVEVPIAAGDGD
jgi:signal transduction histidine kinase